MPALEEFLQQISLYTDQDGLREEESLVTLMTLHNAKGLEYDAVFMIGCEEGVFPHMRALEEGGEEEERRLCYVGITRARRRLYMTWARERRLFGGRRERGIVSRFVDELPEDLVERHSSAPASHLAGRPASAAGARRSSRGPALELQTGDDVVHASFGDGVVTAIEPGGVIVVRFAGDGTERKLMADYAPIRKAMSARLIDGKAVAAEVRERVRLEVAEFAEQSGRTPALATVIVGDDPASEIYVANKHKACEEAGHAVACTTASGPRRPRRSCSSSSRELGADDDVDGILVQLPVPEQIDADAVVAALDPGKDVDGLTPTNAGLLASGTPGLVPCTPAGVIELLDHEGVDLEGAEAIGRRTLQARRPAAGEPAARRAARP